jgi:hypothetical protein
MIHWIKERILRWLCPECPVLRGKDVEAFLKRTENPEPCGLVPTPKLAEVKKMILERSKDDTEKLR